MKHITLTTKDFYELTQGRCIEHDGVLIRLTDIGFILMRDAIHTAEFEHRLKHPRDPKDT